MARTTPLCPDFGYSRGTPIDRLYIEHFLDEHAADIRGRVIEVGDDTYSRRFGGEKVSRQDVLHLHDSALEATVTGDLTKPDTLPSGAFDCIILTQTLQLIFDLPLAIEQLHGALRPGGVLLVTVPGITRIDRGEWKDSWCWSFTEVSLRRTLSERFSADAISSSTYGNLLAATAFLHGAAVEDVNVPSLSIVDSSYPVIVAARARA